MWLSTYSLCARVSRRVTNCTRTRNARSFAIIQRNRHTRTHGGLVMQANYNIVCKWALNTRTVHAMAHAHTLLAWRATNTIARWLQHARVLMACYWAAKLLCVCLCVQTRQKQKTHRVHVQISQIGVPLKYHVCVHVREVATYCM